jgi:hypothetical protein
MNPENQNTPETSTFSATPGEVTTEALEQAMRDKQAFADEVNAQNETATPKMIEVTDIPGYAEKVDVTVSDKVKDAMGDAALKKRAPIPLKNPSPAAMANAINSPYMRDAAGRVIMKVPKDF